MIAEIADDLASELAYSGGDLHDVDVPCDQSVCHGGGCHYGGITGCHVDQHPQGPPCLVQLLGGGYPVQFEEVLCPELPVDLPHHGFTAVDLRQGVDYGHGILGTVPLQSLPVSSDITGTEAPADRIACLYDLLHLGES